VRVAYFTAGTIGAGHHVRGVAIGRGLARVTGEEVEYRTFGPALPCAGGRRFIHCEVPVSRAELEDPTRAPEGLLARAIGDYRPDVLLIDMFWAPLCFVLPALASLGCEAWLLLRKCPSAWFGGPSAAMQFEASRYARILAIEPNLGTGPWAETIEPIVVANADECRPKTALRAHFDVPDGVRLDVVVHAGRPGERAELRGAGAEARVLDLFDESSLFPAAEWLGGADRIATGAGYNSFWEAQWLRYAERTTFTPFARPIDDQGWRIRACSAHAMRENGADALARALVGR
jgi:hypothetical protein